MNTISWNTQLTRNVKANKANVQYVKSIYTVSSVEYLDAVNCYNEAVEHKKAYLAKRKAFVAKRKAAKQLAEANADFNRLMRAF